MPRRRLVCSIAFALLAAAAACDSFGEGDTSATPVPPEAGAIDDSGHNPAPDAVVDDAAVPSDANVTPSDGLYLTCPPTSTKADFHTWNRRTIVKGDTNKFDAPWAIQTDAQFVYWVSQFPDPNVDADDPTVAPYNGSGKARIHRVSKSASNVEPADTILAVEAPGTQALALDGDFIYWAFQLDNSTARIRRVKRDCQSPCDPAAYVDVKVNQPIVRMRRARPGLIFAMTADGMVASIDTLTKQATVESQANGLYPSLAVVADSAFVSWNDKPNVLRVGLGATASGGKFVEDAGAPGASQLSTNCTQLFALRGDKKLWSADVAKASSFQAFAATDQIGVYDSFADQDYVYLASADGQGIRVVDIAKQLPINRIEGSYWRVWADDTGLYAGDHDRHAPGAIYMFGN